MLSNQYCGTRRIGEYVLPSNPQIVAISSALVADQSTLTEEVNECCLCGLDFGSTVLAPGDSQTMTISVDDTICLNGPLFSMASMLGEVTVRSLFLALGSISRMDPRGSIGVARFSILEN